LEAVLADPVPLAVMAGAGSGKTKLITARIAHQIDEGVDPERLFVSAFTKASANEMEERVQLLVENDKLKVGTFHSHLFRFLNDWREAHEFQPYGVMKEGRKKIVFQKLLEKPSRDYPQAVNLDADVGNVMGAIGRWKNANIGPTDDEVNETLVEAPPSTDLYAAALVYPLYEGILHDENLVDFDDMLFKSLRMLLSDQGALNQARQIWSEGVFIDEAQDLNVVQWMIMNLLAPPSENPNLTVVGDLRQCLYAWRGASPSTFERFVEQYRNAQIVDLVNN
ncbi:MAG: UvrD-helicase domain-containing protein, partial [bacterium]